MSVQVLQLDANHVSQLGADQRAEQVPDVRSVVTWRAYLQRDDILLAKDTIESFLRNRLMTGHVSENRQGK